MSDNYHELHSNHQTPQSQPILGSTQIRNNAGGFVWEVDPWDRLMRFLIIGSAAPTYYAGAKTLTREHVLNITDLVHTDGNRVLDTILMVDNENRAPSKDPMLYAIALCAAVGEKNIKRRAILSVLHQVARTGTDILHFCAYVQSLRGWGRLLRRGVAKWYEDRAPDDLAYQIVKYRQRDGWTQRDVLRKAHPRATTPQHALIYDWVCRGTMSNEMPEIILAAQACMQAESAQDAAALITKHKLPREVVPTELLNELVVWEALYPHMPGTALIRNLGKMSSIGLLKVGSVIARDAADIIADPNWVAKSRLHPMALLLALHTYRGSQGFRGSLTWKPVPIISDALEEAFYLSFGNVKPIGGHVQLCLDISSSMATPIRNGPISCAMASGAMAMVTARTETDYSVMGFSNRFIDLNITKKDSLDDVMKKIRNRNFGGTDCSLPMVAALKHKHEIDMFAVYTDNETWAGDIHPSQALQKYNKTMSRQARLAVVGMASNGFTIADPNSKLMLDVVGMDAGTPNIISAFGRGDI